MFWERPTSTSIPSEAGTRARRRWRSSLIIAAAASTLLLSGCAAGMISQSAQEVAAIDGANGEAGPIGVRNVELVTPPAGNYPKGSDVPMQLVLTNNSIAADTLTSVSSPAATSVKQSGPIGVPAKSVVTVAVDGTHTLTLSGVTKVLCYGQTIPLTFSFTQAGQITVEVPIQIPATRTGNRPTIDNQPAPEVPLWETGKHAAEPSAAQASPANSGGASAAPATACNG